MKILILYGSKTGATEKCARKILAAVGEDNADIFNLGKTKIKKADLEKYDKLAIGTPIYMGQIHRKVKKFLLANSELLEQKELHFFVCGLALGEQGIELFQKKVPEKLFTHAKQIRQLGNEINPEKLNPFYRKIIEKIIAEEKPQIGLDEAEISAFAQNLI